MQIICCHNENENLTERGLRSHKKLTVTNILANKTEEKKRKKSIT